MDQIQLGLRIRLLQIYLLMFLSDKITTFRRFDSPQGDLTEDSRNHCLFFRMSLLIS